MSVFWHDWCGKSPKRAAENGGCPCPKTEQERDTRVRESEERHAAAVRKAAGGPPVEGLWLTSSLWSLVHYFQPGSRSSVCGKTVRRSSGAVPPVAGDRYCSACEQAEMKAGGRP